MLYKYVELNKLDSIVEQAYNLIEQAGVSKHTTLVQLDRPWEGKWDRFYTIVELTDELRRLNLIDYWQSTAVVTVYNEGLTVHLDSGEPDYTLIIPIKNGEYSWLVFYEASAEPELRKIDDSQNSSTYLYYDPTCLTELDRVKVDRPILANIKVPHGVIMEENSPEPRITITIRMRKEFPGLQSLKDL